MSFRHHLALFKDLSCPLLPTIARHCPRLPAKKMSQALVASQYGRGSRGPGRVPRAAPRQPGCTAEQTNHEPRSFLACGASRREFRGLHETRDTKHGFIRRGCTRDAQSETAAWNAVHAARSLLSCALWRGMGRLWRGMGGMGRPEPLSAHRPHQQQGLSGFNETRDTNHGLSRVLRPSGGEKCRLSASVGRPAVFKGGCTKRCVNEWKGVYPNPERKITTFPESRFGSGFGIPHYSSEFVGKIRISPCRQSSASAHAARSLLSCALWSGTGRLWRGMGGILPLSSVPVPDRRSRWQPLVKPRVAPRAARIAPRAALRPADKERRGSILDIFDRGATQFRRDASPLNLHVSPRGEAKCVRGPSGLGASRAEEKGASRLARAGVLEQYVEHGKQAQRSPGARIACFDRRVVRNAG